VIFIRNGPWRAGCFRDALLFLMAAMDLHFLVSGYLFYWLVIGVDPT
jgi:hypothetical protein